MTPLFQLAVDIPDLAEALRPLRAAAPRADIVEAGTILILSEGLRAVSGLRALYPAKTLLADVRIAEAGSLIARHCFAAGADWVSCVSGASLDTIGQVGDVAREFGGEVQVELGENYSPARAQAWRELGVQHAIVKRSRDKEAAGDLSWGEADLARISELAAMGFTVSITGGIQPGDLGVFAGAPVGVVIAGRSVLAAPDPRQAAEQLAGAIARVWP